MHRARREVDDISDSEFLGHGLPCNGKGRTALHQYAGSNEAGEVPG